MVSKNDQSFQNPKMKRYDIRVELCKFLVSAVVMYFVFYGIVKILQAIGG